MRLCVQGHIIYPRDAAREVKKRVARDAILAAGSPEDKGFG
jgi:hypothetical protein